MRQLKRALLGGVFGLALSALGLPLGSAQAQTPQPNYGQTVGPGSSFNASIENYLYSGVQVTSAALTGCVGGSPTITGGQNAMKVQAGSNSVTTCTITWPIPRSVAPNCVLQSNTAGPTLPVITVENTTTLTWTWTTATVSTNWDVICLGPR